MIRRPPRSTHCISSAASDVYKRQVEVIEVAHTHPASFDSLIQTYHEAFAQYPRLKLMALTHVTHRTGLVMPVAAIAKAARERAIDVILDLSLIHI